MKQVHGYWWHVEQHTQDAFMIFSRHTQQRITSTGGIIAIIASSERIPMQEVDAVSRRIPYFARYGIAGSESDNAPLAIEPAIGINIFPLNTGNDDVRGFFVVETLADPRFYKKTTLLTVMSGLNNE